MDLRRTTLAGALGALIFGGAAAAHEYPKPRLLTVGGEGDISVAPDRADVGLAVEASEKGLADAERKVGDGVGRLLKLCDGLGIARSQIRSAQLSVQPLYEYSKGGQRPQIIGYNVSRQLDVDLRDLALLGRLMQGAIEAGANRVTGPAFGSSKKDEHQRAALTRAAEDARANAQALARTLGVKLGALHSLAAGGSGGVPPPMPYIMRAEAKAAHDTAQTYEAGEIKFTATVTADFELAP